VPPFHSPRRRPAPRQLRRMASCQAELDAPAEEQLERCHGGGKPPPRRRLVSPSPAHFCSLLKRPALRFLRYQAILTPRNLRRPSIEPGHSDEAGFTSPFRRRICRGDRVRCAAHAAKHRGILSVPHAAEVHRFDTHAPGSPKRNRTTVRAHVVAIPHPSGNAVSQAAP
jgi:hypothetical protein